MKTPPLKELSFLSRLESRIPVDEGEELIKETTSRCLVCRRPKPAKVIKVKGNSANGSETDGKDTIIMRRICHEHGLQDSLLSSDARFYWLAKGDPNRENPEDSKAISARDGSGMPNKGCGCGPSGCSPASKGGKEGYLGTNALDDSRKGKLEKLSTCLALIEIVDSCNLACPTCFADSPVGTSGGKLKYHPFDELTKRIQGILDKKGHIEIIQFSGGEPTLHPEFFQLVEWVRTNPGIDYLLVNTNGVKLANDPDFIRQMGEAYSRFSNIQLYLQFDGPQEAGQRELRGGDLRAMREKAIANCKSIGLPITLAMTVQRSNLPHLWDTVEFARQHDHIRGISFQPMFLSGRTSVAVDPALMPVPITTADVILGLHEQSAGVISLDDFTPLPCGDPNCSTIGWLIRICEGDEVKWFSPAEFGFDIARLQRELPDRINYSIEDLQKCGCEDTELGDLMKQMEATESNAFRLFIKPFMDERTWDDDRIDRCCTHVIRPDGKLDSFCRYYYGDYRDNAAIVASNEAESVTATN